MYVSASIAFSAVFFFQMEYLHFSWFSTWYKIPFSAVAWFSKFNKIEDISKKQCVSLQTRNKVLHITGLLWKLCLFQMYGKSQFLWPNNSKFIRKTIIEIINIIQFTLWSFILIPMHYHIHTIGYSVIREEGRGRFLRVFKLWSL